MRKKMISVLMATDSYSEHSALVMYIQSALGEDQYDFSIWDINSKGEMKAFFDWVKPENCQLVLNLDMTSYQFMAIGNYARINMLPMNLVNYLFQPVENFENYLNYPITYMTSFILTSKAEYEKLKSQYPKLWHVDLCSNFHELAAYLNKLDWKY